MKCELCGVPAFILILCGHCVRNVCIACARQPIDVGSSGDEGYWKKLVCKEKAAEWVLVGDSSIRTVEVLP